jgi:hypothetical protein
MADKIFNSRIIHKHDSSENWGKATNFIPKQGEIIVYDKDSTHNYERIKIGDGQTSVSALPFVDDTKVDKVSGKGLSTNDYTTADKNKLDNIEPEANKTVVDSALSTTSTNPVQNKVISQALSDLVGETPVVEQIRSEIDKATADDFGIYVQANEPENAVAGDIWIDTISDPEYTAPTLPKITAADNGKVLMVVNGTLQLVKLNMSIDANGVVSM